MTKLEKTNKCVSYEVLIQMKEDFDNEDLTALAELVSILMNTQSGKEALKNYLREEQQ
jgi:hypothetical protein|tara:strand:+ start:445 stop:618 length:174 start_codon:yes stop_codon:yes gene_type:complete